MRARGLPVHHGFPYVSIFHALIETIEQFVSIKCRFFSEVLNEHSLFDILAYVERLSVFAGVEKIDDLFVV